MRLPLHNSFNNQYYYKRCDAGQGDGSAGFGVGTAGNNQSRDHKQDGERNRQPNRRPETLGDL